MFSTYLTECPGCRNACKLTNPQCPMGERWAASEEKRKAEDEVRAKKKQSTEK